MADSTNQGKKVRARLTIKLLLMIYTAFPLHRC